MQQAECQSSPRSLHGELESCCIDVQVAAGKRFRPNPRTDVSRFGWQDVSRNVLDNMTAQADLLDLYDLHAHVAAFGKMIAFSGCAGIDRDASRLGQVLRNEHRLIDVVEREGLRPLVVDDRCESEGMPLAVDRQCIAEQIGGEAVDDEPPPLTEALCRPELDRIGRYG